VLSHSRNVIPGRSVIPIRCEEYNAHLGSKFHVPSAHLLRTSLASKATRSVPADPARKMLSASSVLYRRRKAAAVVLTSELGCLSNGTSASLPTSPTDLSLLKALIYRLANLFPARWFPFRINSDCRTIESANSETDFSIWLLFFIARFHSVHFESPVTQIAWRRQNSSC
jgi:hypothetical protein